MFRRVIKEEKGTTKATVTSATATTIATEKTRKRKLTIMMTEEMAEVMTAA